MSTTGTAAEGCFERWRAAQQSGSELPHSKAPKTRQARPFRFDLTLRHGDTESPQRWVSTHTIAPSGPNGRTPCRRQPASSGFLFELAPE